MLHCRVTGAYWCRAGCSGGPWGTAANTGEGELHPAPALPQHLPGDGVGRGDTGPPRTVRRGLSPHVSPWAYDPVSPHGPHIPLCPPHIPTFPCSFVCCSILTLLCTPMSPVSSCLPVPHVLSYLFAHATSSHVLVCPCVPMPLCPPCLHAPVSSMPPCLMTPCSLVPPCPRASVSLLSP